MKKYALLYFQQINEKFSKWIFPLHEGENIIGSDRDVDIFLYLNKSEDIIDGVHCKIIVNENDIGIISLTSSGYVKREQGLEKIILSPGKEYELKNKTIFYLTDNIKFILIKGTINEIHDFFLSENLENEFQKWNKFILTHENKMKINLNLNRKESYNKSFISNANNNENNINLNSSLNNNLMLNSAKSNKNLNKNISNSVLGSNSKDINRIGFNNFDEVPEDNIINDYKISQLNPNPINLAKNLINKTDIKNEIYETPKKKEELNNNLDINNSNDRNNNKNQMNYNDIINNNIINEKETEINTMKSEIKEEINLSKKIDTKEIKENNSLELFKQASSEYKKNNNEKIINKDEKTLQIIKELLGENNLENIINNTDYKNIKKYDISYKKTKKNKLSEGGFGNFDIQVKNNKFINS
jgi:hypothetical protein